MARMSLTAFIAGHVVQAVVEGVSALALLDEARSGVIAYVR